MKPHWWTYIRSFVQEVVIERTSSPHNELLEINLVSGRYQLCTKEAIYSYADKYDNFRLSFKQMKSKNFDFENVLLLGFGLGSVPFMLEKIFDKSCRYTGVEIDEEVIRLASKYVIGDLKSDIDLITADALSFVAIDQNKYDLIIMDVFQSDKIPKAFEQQEFLLNIKDLLVNEGVFLYNRLAYTEEDRIHSQGFYDKAFRKVFPEAYLHEVKGNYMLANKNVFN